MVRTEQRIDKIPVGIKSLPVRLNTRKYGSRPALFRSPNHGGGCGRQKTGRNYYANSPHQKTMRGITKIYFVRVNIDPLRAQSACKIAAHGRSDGLRHDQPDDGYRTDR